MACISLPTAMAVGAGVQGIGGLITGNMKAGAAKEASKVEAKAATAAAEQQAKGILKGSETQAKGLLQGGTTASKGVLAGSQTTAAGYDKALTSATSTFSTAKNALNPYLQTGATGSSVVNGLLGGAGADPAQIQATLESLPGYQFTLAQGLKAAQSGFAAKGLGTSGAAQRGAADYAAGLASQTYNMLFANAMEAANLGAGAANTLAGLSTNFMNLSSELTVGGATARGAGIAESGKILGEAQSGAAAARAGGQTGAAASRAAGKLGAASAKSAGIVGGTNALTGGLNALTSGLGNAFTTIGLYKGGFFNNGSGASVGTGGNALMPGAFSGVGAGVNG